MRGAVRHRAGGEEVQGRRRWLLRGLPVSGLSVCLHTISSPRQWVVCLSPYRIIASCAAAPSSRTKSSDDCGWSAGARGGRRGGGGGESGGRRSGGGLRDRMCVGEGAVRLSVSSWLRHHSSVTISNLQAEGGGVSRGALCGGLVWRDHIIASCAAAPSSRTGSDCGGASEREGEGREARRPHGGGGGGGGGEGGEGGDGR